ncbi:hypothetical protein MTR_2g027310 [Medicago truncatula]|uniref:Uncharacterized protein n=1 Tax=Medicago truncatula TaxID=3880 RepID=G7IQ37_MEDTR|nr:hypothetical protein MTR_2g027310 [Medicago truncatula]
MQNLIATKPGIQKITGITVFATRGMKSYEPLPDLEVSRTDYVSNSRLTLVFNPFF